MNVELKKEAHLRELDFFRSWIFSMSFGFVFGLVFMEQPLARSGCYGGVFVFEHFFYSSATHILYSQKSTVNSSFAYFFNKPVYNFGSFTNVSKYIMAVLYFPCIF